VRTELPLQVSELVMSAMSRNPEERPQTMDGLEYELNKCLAGRGVAVAQILGMTTDANVVATLNPGMSMRNLDDGIVPITRDPRGHALGAVRGVGDALGGVAADAGQPSGQHILRPASEPSGGAVSSPMGRGAVVAVGSQYLSRQGTPAPSRASSNDESLAAYVRGAVPHDTAGWRRRS